jgi:hypothetical protein
MYHFIREIQIYSSSLLFLRNAQAMLDSIGQWANAVPPLQTPLAGRLAGYGRSLMRLVTKLDCNWLRLQGYSITLFE